MKSRAERRNIIVYRHIPIKSKRGIRLGKIPRLFDPFALRASRIKEVLYLIGDALPA